MREAMCTQDWWEEQKKLEAEVKSAQQRLDAHRSRCSHKLRNGERNTFPVGGGESMCRACRTQLD